MKPPRELAKLLEVLESQIEWHQAECAAATQVKNQLRERQMALAAYENMLLDGLDQPEMLEPDAFRLRELRLQKLDQMRNDLQPLLARAATDHQSKQEGLKRMLRIQALFNLQHDQMREKSSANDLNAGVDPALYHFKKGL